MSSTATISLQDDTEDNDTPDLGDVDQGALAYAEELDEYKSDLFYPICIGEVLENTYRIEHKLGHGYFSTVWLARDTKKKRDVALKVLARGSDNEYTMQKKIRRDVQDTPYLVTYLTTFFLTGRRGNHRVLVFPVRGPNFQSVMMNQISTADRMSAAWQLLKALECLHNAKIVHHNLNRRCVMWGVAPLDNLGTKAKYKYLGRPKKMPLPSDLWKRGELVRPLKVPKSLITDAVYLGDFRMATKAGTKVKHEASSPADIRYYAPERFHNESPSFASDMWSYMCLFSDLYLTYVPWSSSCHGTLILIW
jgi:serine/threonine protein kinase